MSGKTSKTKILNVRLPNDVHDDLGLIAQVDDKSMSTVLCELAEEYVRERMRDADFVERLTELTKRQQAIIAAATRRAAGAA